VDAKAEPVAKKRSASGSTEQQEHLEELGKESKVLCRGSPIQEQIRVRKRETSREEGGPGKNQEEGTSRPTFSVLKLKRQS